MTMHNLHYRRRPQSRLQDTAPSFIFPEMDPRGYHSLSAVADVDVKVTTGSAEGWRVKSGSSGTGEPAVYEF